MNIRTKIELNKSAYLTEPMFRQHTINSALLTRYVLDTIGVHDITRANLNVKHARNKNLLHIFADNFPRKYGNPCNAVDMVEYIAPHFVKIRDIVVYFKINGFNNIAMSICFETGELNFIFTKSNPSSISPPKTIFIKPYFTDPMFYSLYQNIQLRALIKHIHDPLVYQMHFEIRSDYLIQPNDILFPAPWTTRRIPLSFKDILLALNVMMQNRDDKHVPEQFTFNKYKFNPPLVPKILSKIKARYFNFKELFI